MGWMILIIVGMAGLVVLFVMLTDGHYFGKWLMQWVYDHVGPVMFAAQSEAERWHTLIEKLQLRGDEKILDVGTAVGDLPLTLTAMPGFRGQAVGIDWSQRMIATAQAEAKRYELDGWVSLSRKTQTGSLFGRKVRRSGRSFQDTSSRIHTPMTRLARPQNNEHGVRSMAPNKSLNRTPDAAAKLNEGTFRRRLARSR